MGAWARENPKLSGALMKIAAIVTIVLLALGGLLLSVSALLMPFAMARFAFAAVGLQGGILSNAIRICTSAFTGLLNAIKYVASAFMWVVRLFMANPILLAIGLLVTAVVLIFKNWEPIKEFFTNLWTSVKTIFTSSVNTIQQYLSSAWDWVGGLFGGIWDAIKIAFNGGISGVITLLFNWSPIGLIYRHWEPITQFFSGLWASTSAEFTAGVNTIHQYLSSAWDWVSGLFGGIWGTIKTAFSGGIAGVGALIVNWSPIGLFYQAFARVLS